MEDTGGTRRRRYPSRRRSRAWLLRAWRSPLGRRVDRAEVLAATAAVVLAALAVPLVVLVHVHLRGTQEKADQEGRQQAMLVSSDVYGGSGALSRSRGEAPVSAAAASATAAGGSVQSSSAAVPIADVVTGCVWVGLVWAGYVLAVRRRLDRRRLAHWDASWQRLVGARPPG